MDEVKALQHIEKIDADGHGDLIEALAGTDPEGADAFIAKAELTDEDKRRVKAALRVMGTDVAKKYLAALEPKVEKEEGAKCPHCDASNKTGALMCKDCGKPMTAKGVSKMANVDIQKNADGSYNLDAFPEEQRPALEAVLKAADTQVAATRAELEKAAAKAQESEARLATIQAETERKESIQKAAEFRDLPGANPDDLGPVLLKIKKALDPAEYEKLTSILKASATIVRRSALFTEIGSDVAGANTARAELDKKVDDLRKSNPKLTVEAARAQVYKSDKALMDRVQAEDAERRQRARE